MILLLSIDLFAGRLKKSILKKSNHENEYSRTHRCPVCGSMLHANQKIHSVIYTKKSNEICRSIKEANRIDIWGCPLCYAEGEPVSFLSIKRTCPVCKHELESKDFLIGKIWIRNGKRHLHILGCSICLKAS